MTPPDTDNPVDAALEIAFGDDVRDPGPVVDALRADPEALRALRDVRATLGEVRQATRPDSPGDGLQRLDALLAEVARAPHNAASAAGSHAQQSVVIDPESASGRVALSRARARWFGAALLAAAAAIVLTLRLWPSTTPTTPPPAQLAAVEARGDVALDALQGALDEATPGGMGFAGTTLTPVARGYLFAVARDAQLAAAMAGGERARALAVDALDRIARDLEPAVAPADIAALGCPALYPAGAARTTCEHGVTLYRLKRDMGTDMGDRLLRAPRAQAARAWLSGLALPELAGVAIPEAGGLPAGREGGVTPAERAAWSALLSKVRTLLEARLE